MNQEFSQMNTQNVLFLVGLRKFQHILLFGFEVKIEIEHINRVVHDHADILGVVSQQLLELLRHNKFLESFEPHDLPFDSWNTHRHRFLGQ